MSFGSKRIQKIKWSSRLFLVFFFYYSYFVNAKLMLMGEEKSLPGFDFLILQCATK